MYLLTRIYVGIKQIREVFIGEDDKVLTFDNFYKFIQDNGINANYTYSKQDHRFQDISSVIAKLSKEIIYF